ncbi:MAG: indole-3-glycerol phosphate synthase TrpC [Alphaproteobacteria bacterium]|nr:MAG: indole-3-glycerol phosphate synthase TrpC [Alphaproteobacteria bacterium]TAF14447.1 MAG: indole-3-glycerol phosphate synthase TrpC [Alphaproteobacteria bacterium]TAF77601.1 MAG: indole-3-glycerol phosphate synthase TrpC [Alphaproteobacteria bacterium]
MSDTLTEIMDYKRGWVAERVAHTPIMTLRERCTQQTPPRGFIAALKQRLDAGAVGLIAELKKASPSKGLIREDFDPVALADAYRRGGATCLSVLTDVRYFQGDDAYLSAVRDHCPLPLLRKDFMCDPYQIVESRALGADCVLLIMAALSNAQARELEDAAHELGMDVLIETHDAHEVERALAYLTSPLMGVNNRNLKNLQVDIRTTELLRPLIPADHMVVCESGISTHADVQHMRTHGVHMFLVGESLMRHADVEQATRLLINGVESCAH